MHEIVSEEGKIVHVRVSGKLTQEDYEKLIPTWQRVIARAGAMRLLLVMEDFHGWEIGAAWDDLRFEIEHRQSVERVAMVGDKAWEKWMIKIGALFAPDLVKYFDASEIAEAEKWVRA